MDFLSKILPRTGVYVGTFFSKEGKIFNKFYDTVEQLQADITKYDSQGYDAYHACATYKEKGNRKADNAGWMRSIWLDIDVGKANDAKSYATRKEAKDALVDMCRTYNLPIPMLVLSGAGLHCYWVLDADLPKEEWKPIVTAFAKALDAVGFKHDPSRTRDAASILRPVGSHWRKNGEREVKVALDAAEIPVSRFDGIVSKFSIDEKPKALSAFQVSDDLGTIEYPPSSAHQVIKFCPSMAEVAEKKGNVPEPLWRAMIGVVKACIEDDEVIHGWSDGYEGYSRSETQKKIDGWQSGPTTCAHFSELSDKCSGCSYNGKIKSPIQLGIIEQEQTVDIQPEPEVVEKPAVVEATDIDSVPLPKGYQKANGMLCKMMQDENGVLSSVPFCNQIFVVTMRIKNSAGEMVARCRRQVYEGEWRTFEIPTSILAQRQQLFAALAAQEIYPIGKLGQTEMGSYITSLLEDLRHKRIEVEVYDAYGWEDSFSKFVLGNMAVTKDGDVLIEAAPGLQKMISNSNNHKAHMTAGSVKGWVDGINHLYNHDGAEAAQYVICQAFSSPLIAILGIDGWNGIPTILAGDSGKGKTKVVNVACSIFGPGSAFQIGGGDEMVTANARIQALGRFRHAPVLLDELSGISKQDLAQLLYSLPAGKAKSRLDASGELTKLSNLFWGLKPFLTIQTPLDTYLSGIRREVQNATSLRAFGFNVNADDGWNLNVDSKFVENFVNTQYGLVGRVYLKALIMKREEIQKRGVKAVNNYAPENMEEDERFLRRDIATTMFAAKIAKSLGLINFDLEKLQAWAERQVLSMRASRGDATYSVEDYLNSYLGSLLGRTIVTSSFGDGRKEVESPQVPLVKAPVARRVIDKVKPRLIVTRKDISDWCVETKLDSGWFVTELKKKKYILENPKAGAPICVTGKMVRIGSGTNVPTSPTYTYEFDTSKLSGGGEIPLADVSDFDEAAAVRKFKQK